MSVVLTPFARTRLFPRDRRRSAIQDCSAEEFERHLNDEAPVKVLDGYAPFCKLHVHRNWTSTRCTATPITVILPPNFGHSIKQHWPARTALD